MDKVAKESVSDDVLSPEEAIKTVVTAIILHLGLRTVKTGFKPLDDTTDLLLNPGEFFMNAVMESTGDEEDGYLYDSVNNTFLRWEDPNFCRHIEDLLTHYDAALLEDTVRFETSLADSIFFIQENNSGRLCKRELS